MNNVNTTLRITALCNDDGESIEKAVAEAKASLLALVLDMIGEDVESSYKVKLTAETEGVFSGAESVGATNYMYGANDIKAKLRTKAKELFGGKK